MSLIFREQGHKYESINPTDNITWTSVTSLIHKLTQPFDAIEISEKVSKNKKSKWYGLEPEKIREIWNRENKRATTLGSYYHDQRETDMNLCDTIRVEGKDLKVTPSIMENGVKKAPPQKLEEGVYPEHLVYLKSAGTCGQADYVDVVNGYINLSDFKTNKEIKKKSFVNWEGISQKLKAPLNHLDDCNFIHYTLQLSAYMYMMLKHNRKLKPGRMVLKHIIFEIKDEDEYGYPIHKLDQDGNPIVADIVEYEVPYLRDEIIDLLNWHKNNK